MKLSRITLIMPNALASVVCGASLSWSQAQNLHAPAEQRELSDILSKYNDLIDGAPNKIQRDKIEATFRKEFCAKIPRGEISGWIGIVVSVDDRTDDKAINLELEVSTYDLKSGSLGIGLSLGNRYSYGVNSRNTQPHEPTTIPIGSSLYAVASNLRPLVDAVRFSGTFIPYASPQACYDNSTSYFSLFSFTSIQRLAGNIHLY
jgi:hypothetical protein